MAEASSYPKLRIKRPLSGQVSLTGRETASAQNPAQTVAKPPAKPQATSVEDLYARWQQDPTPDNGGQLLKTLEPHIAASARKYAKDDNPVLMGRAKSLVIDALPRFDPKRGASLVTFIDRQLQPLQRWQARKTLGVRVPTRDVQLRKQLENVSMELEDELGRAPSLQEIADRSGTPYKEITRLNRQTYPQIAEREMAGSEGGHVSAGDQAVDTEDLDLWKRAVYHDLSPVDQFIMQHTWGIYGAPQLSTQTIAKRLKITPGAVSQRRAKIDGYLRSTQ